MDQIIHLITSMAPYLLLGFLLAGLMHAFIPATLYNKHLSQSNFRSTFLAAMFGIPLPLCSCGVIPTAMSLRKEGASKGATVSFLIATPQTGVDSIMATYSLLGLPYAILRPIAAICTALFGGTMVNLLQRDTITSAPSNNYTTDKRPAGVWERIVLALKYGFVEMMQDIGKWLILGLIVAGIITVVVPDSFFELFSHNSLLSMLIVLLFSIPMYLCATGSIPIAVALMLKGLSPGTALVLLMAGPAINFASMLVIGKVMGRKTLIIYITSIILGAMTFGLAMDHLLPREWFTSHLISASQQACHHASWLDFNTLCSIALVALLGNAMIQKFRTKHSETCCSCDSKCNAQAGAEVKHEQIYHIEGMRCNHCAANVEKALSALPHAEKVTIELQQKRAIIVGEVDAAEVEKAVKALGFELRNN